LTEIPTGEYNVLEELAADAARPHHEQPGLPDPGLQVSGQHTLKLSHLQTLPIPNCLKSENKTLLDLERNCLILPRTLDNPVYTEVYTGRNKQKNMVITRHSSSRKISLHIVHCNFSAVLV
jgi:hypothetical protein